jgi:hypothetical protein
VTRPFPEGDTNKTEEPNALDVAFVGSMKGTMEVTGDIVSPIDVAWEADQGCDQDNLF